MPPVRITLETRIAEAKLITPAVASAMASGLGIGTVGDLLRHYPRRHEDRTAMRPIGSVRAGEHVCIAGAVASVAAAPSKRLSVTKVAVRDESGVVLLTFFNQWFVRKQFEKLIGRKIVAYGHASRDRFSGALQLSEVEWEILEAGDAQCAALSTNRIVPIYALAAGVKQERIRKAVWDALAAADTATDDLPASVRSRQGLVSVGTALRQIHFPGSGSQLEAARQRLAFEHLFAMQLALARRRLTIQAERGNVCGGFGEALVELRSALPFSLTAAQERAIGEIGADMQLPRPMNRLLQGDVGSGKTVVAMAAILAAVRGGFQAAVMAPTEILAEQHYAQMRRVLGALGVPVALLTGSAHTPMARADLLACVEDGHYPVLVGTHALIEAGVRFARLGLVIIDEQHRFGVVQRAALRAQAGAAAAEPDMLVMTATPIPRTLTLAVYGDLDVSVIDALPPGRKPIRTHWKLGAEREQVYSALRNLIGEGRQAYVICSLVEENDRLQARAATQLAEHLASGIFSGYSVGLLHGQMKPSEKDEVMGRFRSGEVQVLVSTTVIEVGVDVPNASVIVIEDADRFGLAQLHQLRGRVGRGPAQSYCLLIADAKTPDASGRLEALVRTCDGFEIAEEDLRLRGPGEFYGTRQSGENTMPLIDVLRDASLLRAARDEAFRLVAEDSGLLDPSNAGARRLLWREQRRLDASPPAA